MGTWNHGNLDCDSASDILYEQSKELVDETLKLAGSELACEYDDYDYAKLFVNFEVLFALEQAQLLRYYPNPGQVAELKDSYLASWDACTDENGNGWDHRRAVIAETFDRFRLICQKEQRRRDDMPHWVEVKAPSVSELSRDLALSPHNVFGDLHISLPTTWQAQTSAGPSEVPASTLTHSLLDHSSGRYSVGNHHFTVERVFLASGVSLAPDVERPDYPYLLMARLRVADGSGMPNVNGLVCDTKEVLSPGFQGEGEHVGGSFYFDSLEEFEFHGVQSFRCLKPSPGRGMRRRQKDLYYHKHSADILLLLETGSIQDNDDFHFPDKVLLQHIVDSMRANPKTCDGLLVRMRQFWARAGSKRSRPS